MTRTTTLVPLAGLALLLAACASRPPEPTADTTAARPGTAATQAPSGAERAGANTGTPSGTNTASATSTTPRDRSVYFDFDSTTLSPQAQQTILDNARYEQAQRGEHVRLEGNADERGSREYNLALGQRRAEAVRQAMALDGVAANQIEAVSNGEERPRCTQSTEECWAQNRRVDIMAGR